MSAEVEAKLDCAGKLSSLKEKISRITTFLKVGFIFQLSYKYAETLLCKSRS